MYDAVHLFAKALHDLDSSQRIDIKPMSCDAVDTWPHGYSLINYMKVVSLERYIIENISNLRKWSNLISYFIGEFDSKITIIKFLTFSKIFNSLLNAIVF